MAFRTLPASARTIADLPTDMRAVVMTGTGAPESLHETIVPTPAPIMSEVLVRVAAAGVSPIDADIRAGRMPGATEGVPIVPGFDFSGVVVSAPYDAHPLQPGTEVFGMAAFPRTGGAYADYVVAPVLSVAKKPLSLSHAEAAGVPLAALTAWGLVVETARAHEGQRILITGASGGVGHLAVQLASYFGAHVTTTSSARNVGWLRELGAARALDYAAAPFEDEVAEVDVVIDLVGEVHERTATRAVSRLRRGGLYIGLPSCDWGGLSAAAAAAGVRATHYTVIPSAANLTAVTRLIETRAIQVYLDRVLPLAEAAAAHRAIELGHTRGKIVLQVSGD